MRSLRVALAQINPTVGDLGGNVALMRSWLAKAEAAQADLAVFPELAITGYPPEDLLLKPSFVADNLAALKDFSSSVRDTAVVTGFVDRTAAGLHNAAAVAWRGKVRGVYHKCRLPNYGVFDEKRYFVAGSSFPVFVVRGVHVGVSVCEDAWVGEGPVRSLARAGAEVVVNINASPYHRGKGLERRLLFRQRARDDKIFFAYLQTVGGQDELVFDGDSLVFDPSGTLLAHGAQFEEDMLLLDLPLPPLARRGSRHSTFVQLSKAPARPPKRVPLPRQTRKVMEEPEEVYAALLLGARDYLAKNGFTSAVVGMSGGMDSSLVAVIAADAIGPENVLGVAMPSAISSEESVEDAKALATNLGIEFRVIPIAAMHDAFLAALADAFAGREPGVAEENIQSRVRGTILMALSNKFGSLVLATGNKSELAAGYATLYGDMAGGFAVLKDVPKTLVYRVAQWRNERGPHVIPERVFTKPPTAELRPGQLDTDSLPRYEILDPIVEAYVEGDRSIAQIVKRGFDEPVVRRVARMIDQAEYKRRQAPPGVKITPRAFGKDRRLPITNRYREWAVEDAREARRTSKRPPADAKRKPPKRS